MQLKEYIFGEAAKKPGSLWQLLIALKEFGLKNNAMPDLFYEEFGQRCKAAGSFGVYLFHSSVTFPAPPHASHLNMTIPAIATAIPITFRHSKGCFSTPNHPRSSMIYATASWATTISITALAGPSISMLLITV